MIITQRDKRMLRDEFTFLLINKIKRSGAYIHTTTAKSHEQQRDIKESFKSTVN